MTEIDWQPVVTALAGFIWILTILGASLAAFIIVVAVAENRDKRRKMLDKEDTRV